MNKNVIIVLAGGFVIAILVAVLLQAALGGGDKKPEIDTDRIQILVAGKNMKVGHELVAGDLKWQDWPEDAMFGGAIVREDEQKTMDVAKGKLLRSVTEGQPIHSSIMAEEDMGNFLSANIKKGMRGVGVSVNASVLADRLVRPGDYVDVLMTYRVRVNTRNNPEAQTLVNRYATETVIENVRVLAIDKNDTKAINEEEEDGKKKKKKSAKKATLTLEVKPEDAEKLVLADRMGKIGIALRSIGDIEDDKSDQTTTDVGMSRVMTELSTMTGTTSAVRIYDGNQMQEVKPRQVREKKNVDFSLEDAPLPDQNITITPEALSELGQE